MELLENLELVDVHFEDKKAILVFLDEERGEIREVTFNKQSFDREAKKFCRRPREGRKGGRMGERIF